MRLSILDDFQNSLYVKTQLPNLAATIESPPWVVDGMHRADPGNNECGYYVGESFFVELYEAWMKRCSSNGCARCA